MSFQDLDETPLTIPLSARRGDNEGEYVVDLGSEDNDVEFKGFRVIPRRYVDGDVRIHKYIFCMD